MELYSKKYGKKLEQPSIEKVGYEHPVYILKEEYNRLQRQAGQLEAAGPLIKELRSEIKAQNERLAQLEASSAAGWTEARKGKEDLEILKKELQTIREIETEARNTAEWLRREMENTRETLQKNEESLQRLLRENVELSEFLKVRQGEIERCRKELIELRARYRKDGFLG